MKWYRKEISNITTDDNPEDVVFQKEIIEKVRKVIATLTPIEEKILRMRFGILEEDCHTRARVAEIFEVSNKMIAQIEAKAIHRLRHPKRMKMLTPLWESDRKW